MATYGKLATAAAADLQDRGLDANVVSEAQATGVAVTGLVAAAETAAAIAAGGADDDGDSDDDDTSTPPAALPPWLSVFRPLLGSRFAKYSSSGDVKITLVEGYFPHDHSTKYCHVALGPQPAPGAAHVGAGNIAKCSWGDLAVDPHRPCHRAKSTRSGGANPKWGLSIKVPLLHSLFHSTVRVGIKHHSALSVDSVVGVSYLPLWVVLANHVRRRGHTFNPWTGQRLVVAADVWVPVQHRANATFEAPTFSATQQCDVSAITSLRAWVGGPGAKPPPAMPASDQRRTSHTEELTMGWVRLRVHIRLLRVCNLFAFVANGMEIRNKRLQAEQAAKEAASAGTAVTEGAAGAGAGAGAGASVAPAPDQAVASNALVTAAVSFRAFDSWRTKAQQRARDRASTAADRAPPGVQEAVELLQQCVSSSAQASAAPGDVASVLRASHLALCAALGSLVPPSVQRFTNPVATTLQSAASWQHPLLSVLTIATIIAFFVLLDVDAWLPVIPLSFSLAWLRWTLHWTALTMLVRLGSALVAFAAAAHAFKLAGVLPGRGSVAMRRELWAHQQLARRRRAHVRAQKQQHQQQQRGTASSSDSDSDGRGDASSCSSSSSYDSEDKELIEEAVQRVEAQTLQAAAWSGAQGSAVQQQLEASLWSAGDGGHKLRCIGSASGLPKIRGKRRHVAAAAGQTAAGRDGAAQAERLAGAEATLFTLLAVIISRSVASATLCVVQPRWATSGLSCAAWLACAVSMALLGPRVTVCAGGLVVLCWNTAPVAWAVAMGDLVEVYHRHCVSLELIKARVSSHATQDALRAEFQPRATTLTRALGKLLSAVGHKPPHADGSVVAAALQPDSTASTSSSSSSKVSKPQSHDRAHHVATLLASQ